MGITSTSMNSSFPKPSLQDQQEIIHLANCDLTDLAFLESFDSNELNQNIDDDTEGNTMKSTKVASSFPEKPLNDQKEQKDSCSLISKINNLGGHNETENNKSIVRKTQESKKRLQALRLLNTFLLNSDLLTGSSCKNSKLSRL